MNNVAGYLELNGIVFKITSIDELKDFVNRLGSEVKELNDCDFAKLCSFKEPDSNTYKDDCGVIYSEKGNILIMGPIASDEYQIKKGTSIIADEAFRWYNDYQGYKYRLSIGRKAHHIRFLVLPNSVIAIGSKAFYNNQDISEIKMSQEMQYIGEKAFSGCTNLLNFDWASSLRYIGANAFEGCAGFTEVILNDGIKKIGSHVFKDCANLQVVSLPSTIEMLGSGVFEGCSKLKEIRIPKGSTEKFSQLLPFSTNKFVEIEIE